MKPQIILLLCIGWVCCNAQPMPNWLKQRPSPDNDTYYYRVTIGEGKTYDLAYANALAKAILESSWKLGVQVTTSDDIETIKNSILENINIGEVESNIPINKVCEYVEQQHSSKYRIYCLWQIGTPGKIVKFDDFYNCD